MTFFFGQRSSARPAAAGLMALPRWARRPRGLLTATAQALSLLLAVLGQPAPEGTGAVQPCGVEYVCSCATLSEQDYILMSAEVKGNRCAPASHPEQEDTTVWLCGNAVLEAELYDDLWIGSCAAQEIQVGGNPAWEPQAKPVMSTGTEAEPIIAGGPVNAWSLGPWSTCSRACGGGMKQREVHCRQILPVNPGEAAVYVDPAYCQGLLPTAEEACNTHACFFCSVSKPCNGHGECIAANPQQRAPAHCSCSLGWAGDRCQTPVTEATKAQQPCGGNTWDADGKCCPTKLKDAFGQCCPSNSTRLDGNGECCALELDICGVCGGSSQTIDLAGHCCPAGYVVDAAGGCCSENLIDSCGVCNGKGLSCSIRIQLGLQLHPQRFFQSATGLLDSVSPKQELTNELTKLLDLGLGSVADVSHSQLLLATPINNLTAANVPMTIQQRLAGMENGSLMNYFAEVGLPPAGLKYGEVTALMVHNILTELEVVLNSAPVNEADGERQVQIGEVEMTLIQMMALGRVTFSGTCGNSVCEVGEPGGGRTSSSVTSPVCPQDCPKWTLPSPQVQGPGPTCSGQGRWIAAGDGGCDCFTGYMGLQCEQCWLGWERLLDSFPSPCVPSNLVFAQLNAKSSGGVGPSNGWVLNPPQQGPSLGLLPTEQGPTSMTSPSSPSGDAGSAGLLAGIIIGSIAVAGALLTMFASAYIRKRNRAHVINMSHLGPDLSPTAPSQHHDVGTDGFKRFRVSWGNWLHPFSSAAPGDVQRSYPGGDVIFGTPPTSDFFSPSDATPAQLAAQVRSTKSDFNIYPQTPAAAAASWGAQLSCQSSASSSHLSGGELSVTSCETPQSQPVGLYASDSSAMSPWTPRGELGFLRSKLAQAAPKSPYSAYGSSSQDSRPSGSKTPKAGLTPRSLQFNFASPRLAAKSIRKKFRLDAPVDKTDKGKQPQATPETPTKDNQNVASTSSAIDSLPFPTYIKAKLPESMPWADNNAPSPGVGSPRSPAGSKRFPQTPKSTRQPPPYTEARGTSLKLSRFGSVPGDLTPMAAHSELLSPPSVVEPWMTGEGRLSAARQNMEDYYVSPRVQEAGVQPLNLSNLIEASSNSGTPSSSSRHPLGSPPSLQGVQPVTLFTSRSSSSHRDADQVRTPAPVKSRPPSGDFPAESPFAGAARFSTPRRAPTTPGGSSIAHLGIRPVRTQRGSLPDGEKPFRISTPQRHKSTRAAGPEVAAGGAQPRQEGLLALQSTPRATRPGVRSNLSASSSSELEPSAETYSVVLRTPSGMSRQELLAKLRQTGIRPDQMELRRDSGEESTTTSYDNPSFDAGGSPEQAESSAVVRDNPLAGTPSSPPSLPVSTLSAYGGGDDDDDGSMKTVTPDSAPSP